MLQTFKSVAVRGLRAGLDGTALKAMVGSALRLGVVLGVRVISGLGGIAFAAVVSRSAGAALLGSVAIWVSAAVLIGFLARGGFETCITKVVTTSLSTEKEYPVAALLARALKRTAIGGGLLTGLVLLVAYGLSAGGWWFADSFLLVIAAVPLAHLGVVSGYARGTHRVALAGMMDLGAVSLFAALGLLVVLVTGGEVTGHSVSLTFVGVSALMSAAAIVWSVRDAAQLGRGSSSTRAASTMEVREFERGKYQFMLIGLAGFVTQAGAFAVVGPFLAEADLGLARAAERLALLVSFPLTAVNAFITPRLVRELTAGTPRSLRLLLAKACVASAGMAVPITLVLLLFPGEALAFFGPEFIVLTGGLIVMTLTQFVTAATGPMGMLLLMSGRERDLLWITVGAFAACLVLFPLGSIVAGVSGFIAAYMLVNVGKAVALVVWGMIELDRRSRPQLPAAEEARL